MSQFKVLGRAGKLLCTTSLVFMGAAEMARADIFDEIVVTAQKREQSLQDVGVSVTAFSGEQIKELGYTNTIDLAAQTPALNVIQFHPSLTTLVIRGVSQNDFADHLEPPIAMYVDEAYVSAMGAAHAQIFDMERVEVLRGPQGTLFGRNATGGLMHFISKKPTDEMEGYAEITIGSFEQIKLEGAISGPISENLSARLSVASNKHDGLIKNRIGDDPRDADSYAGRLQLLFTPSDNVELLLKAHFSKDDSLGNAYSHVPAAPNADGLGVVVGPDENPWGTCNGCDLTGYRDGDNDPYTNSVDNPGFFDREIAGATANLSWDINEGLTLNSVTDYLTIDKAYGEDTDGGPNPLFNYKTSQDFEQISQELRLNGTQETFTWIAGLYYLDIQSKTTGDTAVDIGPLFAAPFGDPNFINRTGHRSKVDTESWAVFGHIDYEFSDTWSVLGAVRYTKDTKKLDWRGFDNFTPPFAQSSATEPLIDKKQTFDNVSAKLELDWRPNEDTLVFASVTRGHKSGNWAVPIGLMPSTGPQSLAHDEEVLTSYEAGLKTTFAEGKVQLNASAFYYDYEDYQAFTIDGSSTSFADFDLNIVNADATAKGAEIELSLNPLEGLNLLAGVSLMDSEVPDIILPAGRIIDSELPYAPEIAFNGLARYEWGIATGGTIALQSDFAYSDNFCFTVLCAPLDREGSYFEANARVSYSAPEGRWKVAAFVKNLTENERRLYSVDISGLGIGNDVYANPRWYGASLSVNW